MDHIVSVDLSDRILTEYFYGIVGRQTHHTFDEMDIRDWRVNKRGFRFDDFLLPELVNELEPPVYVCISNEVRLFVFLSH